MTQQVKKNLPSIQDLYTNENSLGVQRNQLSILLNAEPKKEWLQKHPFAKNVIYLPIERIEFLLNAIFVSWKVEIKESKVIANSVVVTVRVHVEAPTGSGETIEMWQDGIGAAPIQTEKGASATDFSKVNTMGVMQAAPAAESYAIKDAVEKFGRIFGKDLNRKTHSDYSILQSKYLDNQEPGQVGQKEALLIEGASLVELIALFKENPEWKNNDNIMSLVLAEKKKRLNEITILAKTYDKESLDNYWKNNQQWHNMKDVKAIFAQRESELQNG